MGADHSPEELINAMKQRNNNPMEATASYDIDSHPTVEPKTPSITTSNSACILPLFTFYYRILFQWTLST